MLKKLSMWFMVNVLLVLWTADLRQQNRETLFLTKSGLHSFESYKSVIDERRILAVKLELQESLVMTNELYQSQRQVYQALKKKYADQPDAEWLDFYDIYQRAIGDDDFGKTMAFAHSHNALTMPILGDHHAGFLVMMSQSMDDLIISQLMSDIMKAPWPKDFTVYPGGLPYINDKLNQYADDIKFTLIPLMVVVSVLLTMWLTRSLRIAGLIVVPSVFALVQSLALAKGLYGTLNMVTAVVPLMMFVINMMICFHLYYATRKTRSFAAAWSIKGRPLILSVATMAIGFFANIVSDIPVIRQFAIVSGLATIITAIMSTLAMMILEPLLIPKEGDREPQMFQDRWFRKPLPWSGLAGLTVVIVVGVIITAPRLDVLTDATRYFPPSSGLREAILRVENHFLGTPTLELIVKRQDGASLTFDDQKTMLELESNLSHATKRSYKIMSLGSLLTEANELFSGQRTFPPQRITWTMLRGGLPESVRKAFPSQGTYRISLLGNTMNSDEYKIELQGIGKVTEEFSKRGYTVEMNGLNYHLMHAQDQLIGVMAEGFGVTLIMVTILFALTFRRLSTIGFFLLASLLPMGIGLIAIKILGFSLNIATVMTFSIALGMIVDNSFHLTWNRYKNRSFFDYYADTIVPMIGSGLILGLGFGLFSLNGFLPIRQVGVLVAVMLVSGIMGSLFVLR